MDPISPTPLTQDELYQANVLVRSPTIGYLAKSQRDEYEEIKDKYGLEWSEDTTPGYKDVIANLKGVFFAQQKVAKPDILVPFNSDGISFHHILAQAFEQHTVNHISLNGKHSGGTLLVQDPAQGTKYLLKPGFGAISPALGMQDVDATQSKREALFYHVAVVMGLGEYLPECQLMLVDKEEVAMLKMLPPSYTNLGPYYTKHKFAVGNTLKGYLHSGTIHKWAILDWVLGNTDRHSSNLMLDTANPKVIKLIDHGSALAGGSFDPSRDPKSTYIPFYLRCFGSQKNFRKLDSQQQYKSMPKPSDQTERLIKDWVLGLNTYKIESVFRQYHLQPKDYKVYIDRLLQIALTPAPKGDFVNRLWAGLETANSDSTSPQY